MSMATKYKFVTDTIMTVTNDVYPEKAANKAKYPYVVYRFSSDYEIERNARGIFLEIDIWDSKKSNYDELTAIENLTDQIEKLFDYKRYLDDNHLLIFSKLGRSPIPDEDDNIIRRQLRFLIKSYDKNN